MKTKYIQPTLEIIAVNTAYSVCQAVSEFAPLEYGGEASGQGYNPNNHGL